MNFPAKGKLWFREIGSGKLELFSVVRFVL